MPVYEFFCTRCQKPFTATMNVKEHDTGIPACPECGQEDEVERRMSSFMARTSRKSTSY